MNTPRLITDSNGNAVWQWGQDESFGDTIPNQSPNGTGNQFTFNLRFPGQYYDVETGTHYNLFRDYDPATGRYLESDPIGLYGGSLSTYAYVVGNPIGNFDLFGLSGAIPKNFGKYKPITPIEDPNIAMKDRNSVAENANTAGGDYWHRVCESFGFCQNPTDWVCVHATCTDCAGKEIKIDYFDNSKPGLHASDKPWPPSQNDVPKGCKCTESVPRNDNGPGPKFNVPGY